jgi:hypothetical protein
MYFVARYPGLTGGCQMKWEYFGTGHGKNKPSVLCPSTRLYKVFLNYVLGLLCNQKFATVTIYNLWCNLLSSTYYPVPTIFCLKNPVLSCIVCFWIPISLIQFFLCFHPRWLGWCECSLKDEVAYEQLRHPDRRLQDAKDVTFMWGILSNRVHMSSRWRNREAIRRHFHEIPAQSIARAEPWNCNPIPGSRSFSLHFLYFSCQFHQIDGSVFFLLLQGLSIASAGSLRESWACDSMTIDKNPGGGRGHLLIICRNMCVQGCIKGGVFYFFSQLIVPLFR